MRKYFIDFEANLQEIISIGIISEDKKFSIYSLIKPTHLLDKYIRNITHLRDEDFKSAPTATVFFYFLYEAIKKDVNSNFIWDKCEFYVYGDGDASFIKKTMTTITDPETYGFLAGLCLNLKDFSKNTLRFFQKPYSLLNAVNYFRKENEQAEEKHHAYYDALLLLELYNVLPEKGYIGIYSYLTGKIKAIDDKTKKVYKYNDIVEAAEVLIKDMPKGTKIERIENKIKKAIVNKSYYCNIRWELDD